MEGLGAGAGEVGGARGVIFKQVKYRFYDILCPIHNLLISFSVRRIRISLSSSIRQKFKGFCCDSDILYMILRLSPFTQTNHIKLNVRKPTTSN